MFCYRLLCFFQLPYIMAFVLGHNAHKKRIGPNNHFELIFFEHVFCVPFSVKTCLFSCKNYLYNIGMNWCANTSLWFSLDIYLFILMAVNFKRHWCVTCTHQLQQATVFSCVKLLTNCWDNGICCCWVWKNRKYRLFIWFILLLHLNHSKTDWWHIVHRNERAQLEPFIFQNACVALKKMSKIQLKPPANNAISKFFHFFWPYATYWFNF